VKRTTEKYRLPLLSRPLRGLETLMPPSPSAEALGYFQPSAARTKRYISLKSRYFEYNEGDIHGRISIAGKHTPNYYSLEASLHEKSSHRTKVAGE